MENPQVVERIAELKNEDWDIRRDAAFALGEIGAAFAVPALCDALKDSNKAVRRNVVFALGRIGDASAVPTLIEAMQDTEADVLVRHYAIEALGKIGDAAAIPALIEALKNTDHVIRYDAAGALVKIGDASAVPALMEALKDTDSNVRCDTAEALGKIGDVSAVPALIVALKDPQHLVRSYAAEALDRMGSSETLPRKVLAGVRFSAQERINLLANLRHVRYKSSTLTLRYNFPDTCTLCETVLREDDAEVRAGAQVVLNWLEGGNILLRSSQRDTTTDSQNLLRAHEEGTSELHPQTLLHASEPEENAGPPVSRPTLWQRITGNRTNESA